MNEIKIRSNPHPEPEPWLQLSINKKEATKKGFFLVARTLREGGKAGKLRKENFPSFPAILRQKKRKTGFRWALTSRRGVG